jgi:formiminoglutamase
MELKIFFDKVDEQLYENIGDNSSFFHHVEIHGNRFPDLRSAKVALIGLVEDRGNPANEGCYAGADSIRRQLYTLKRNSANSSVVDLGNLRNGPSLSDTYLRIKEVCEILIEKGLFVVLMGGTHDLDFGQYLAYEKFGKMVSMVSVDAVLDLFPDSKQGKSVGHLHDIISHEPNYLFHLCHLGSQGFLNDPAVADIMEKLHFETVRLGQLRENFPEVEPFLRQADMLSFDISSIKKADAPGNSLSNVFGLTGEEACQMTWYAGMSDKLSTAGFFEYNPFQDPDKRTAFVIATMIWYLIEGFAQRKDDLRFDDQHFVRYMVGIGNSKEEILVFYKNKRSEKWWLEVSYSTSQSRDKVAIVPCSYADYECALKGELPDRWVLMHNKLF